MNSIDSSPTLNSYESWSNSTSTSLSNKINDSLSSTSPGSSLSTNSSPISMNGSSIVSILPTSQFFSPSNVSSPLNPSQTQASYSMPTDNGPNYAQHYSQTNSQTTANPYWSSSLISSKQNYHGNHVLHHNSHHSNYSIIAAAAAVAAANNYPQQTIQHNYHLNSNDFKYSQMTNPGQFYGQDTNNLLFNQLAVSAAAAANSNSNSPLSFSSSNKSPHSNSLIAASTAKNIDTSAINHNDSGFESPKALNENSKSKNQVNSSTKVTISSESSSIVSPKQENLDDAVSLNSRRQAWASNC